MVARLIGCFCFGEKIRLMLHYTRGITPNRVKRVTGPNHRAYCVSTKQLRRMSQQWQIIGDSVLDLTDPIIEPSGLPYRCL